MAEIETFKAFVKKHPGLKNEVDAGRKTWQGLYEEWYLYGEEDAQWQPYKAGTQQAPPEAAPRQATSMNVNQKEASGMEMITQAFDYLQKIDLEKAQKTVGTWQQCVNLFQTLNFGKGGAKGAASALGAAGATKSRPSYPGFFSQFND